MKMVKNIHPNTNQIPVTCSCGAKFSVVSVLKNELTIEVCSKCHPFYTGEEKLLYKRKSMQKFLRRFGDIDSQIGKSS